MQSVLESSTLVAWEVRVLRIPTFELLFWSGHGTICQNVRAYRENRRRKSLQRYGDCGRCRDVHTRQRWRMSTLDGLLVDDGT